ncbi:DUF1800 family protein [Ideonella sp. DXS29W]|uniref:DUF1800 family protein n=1 Tax=Ideonella lacteola TaxID=2984193 RepID=A0ABU9BLC9_9BURK
MMRHHEREGRAERRWLAMAGAAVLALAGCGGGAEDSTATAEEGQQRASALASDVRAEGTQAFVTSQMDAVRLAHQATFGPSESLVNEIRTKGPKAWIVSQLGLSLSRYKLGGDNSPDKNTSTTEFCQLPDQVKNPNCWRDYFSSEPLLWDFYRNAVRNNDQLRQRVSLALSQLLVISNVDVDGTYGLRLFYNNMITGAFGNYRDLLRQVAVSPMMGEYLNHVNNDQAAPNENFARELLQLFTIGPCKLNMDGTLVGGRCAATYDNDRVRSYAYALTGWTYPPGGADRWGCHPDGANCKYLYGDMVPAAGTLRDTKQRSLLSNVLVPAGTPAPKALEKVLDSLMSHPNIAPYVGKHMIQQLVTSNPSPEYVTRVAKAFNTGKYDDIGTGKKGDMAAVTAAVLLDKEARNEKPGAQFGRLREPIQLFTGAIRAIGGDTDGNALGFWQGENLSQHTFRSPTVFNYYSQDFPLSGSKLIAPPFGIHNASTALNRLSYLTMLFDWGGADPQKDVPGAVGTKLNYDAWLTDAADATKLVDRMSRLVLGENLPEPARTKVIEAVAHFDNDNYPGEWRRQRVQRAGWLVLSSPQYQIVR